MKRELGIDIDGCLNHYHDDLRDYIKQHYGIDVPDDDYYIVNSLNLSIEEESQFWQRFDNVAIHLKREFECREIIEKLSN